MIILQKKLIIVIMLTCGILAYGFYTSWQKSTVITETAVVTPPPPAPHGADKADTTGSPVIVYVSGGVNRPGVYELPSGSRIVDAVTIAGGLAADADAARINLALLLKDEMQVNVPYKAVAGSNALGAPAVAGSGGSSSDKININTASGAELDKLPGIGPALAERIIEYRTTNGPFQDTADLRKVPGIGAAKFNQFKDKISL